MAEYKDLIIPTVNVNDTKVTISDIQKENLEYIDEHEMLYCVETSKATEDYYPNYAGYVVLFVEDLDEVEVGKSAVVAPNYLIFGGFLNGFVVRNTFANYVNPHIGR